MTREPSPLPFRRWATTHILRGIVAAACAVTLVCTTWTPAGADDLDDRSRELQRQIAAQADQVEEAHAKHDDAVAAAAEARAELADAQAALARAEEAEKKAEELDAQREAELVDAEERLKQAKADVAAAEAALDSVDRRLNEEILVTTQQSSGLLNLALIFTDVDASNLNHRAQLATTLFDSSTRQLDELETRRLALEEAQSEADAAERAASEARAAAAEQLEISQEATDKAEDLKAEVARLSDAMDAAEVAAADAVAAEEKRQRELEAENASVEQRIQDRIAAERKAEQDRVATAASRDKVASSPSSSATRRPATSNNSTSSNARFSYPSSARITSKYGMRLHPVLGYWKLHDGTDFGASCNSPIRAAADGVVSERYYNGGYGNRLMIDHGRVNGTYVTTGYNHATRYIVGVGQTVTQGQVIGYVGSTGYSTGCHLHLMVWENGKVVDPMAKWFG